MPKTPSFCSGLSGFTVFSIKGSALFEDVFEKVHQMLSASSPHVWWELKGVTRTDFTTESYFILNAFLEKNWNRYPKGTIVIVADTALSYLLAKTLGALLRLDGYKGRAMLFRSRETALKWIELAGNVLGEPWTDGGSSESYSVS